MRDWHLHRHRSGHNFLIDDEHGVGTFIWPPAGTSTSLTFIIDCANSDPRESLDAHRALQRCSGRRQWCRRCRFDSRYTWLAHCGTTALTGLGREAHRRTVRSPANFSPIQPMPRSRNTDARSRSARVPTMMFLEPAEALLRSCTSGFERRPHQDTSVAPILLRPIRDGVRSWFPRRTQTVSGLCGTARSPRECSCWGNPCARSVGAGHLARYPQSSACSG